MTDSPSPHGSGGRDRNGRFELGNKFGVGNPLAGRAAKIRSVLLATLTPADAEQIAAKLIERAKQGDLAAIRELLDRTIGRPAAADIQSRIEAIEAAVEEIESHVR